MCMQNESVVKSVVNEDSMMNLSVTDAPAEDLSKLTVPKLKARLKELGAPVNGKKADLIERLTGLLVVEAVSPETSVVEEPVDMESVETAMADISIIETEQPDADEEEVDEPQPAEEMPAAADEPSGRWKVSIVFGATGRPALTIKHRDSQTVDEPASTETAPAAIDLMNASVGSFASFAASMQTEESMCMQNESVVKSVVNEDSVMNLSVTDAPVEDFSKLTVPKLKARLKELGVPVNGKKADLIERLTGLLVVEAVVKEVAALEEVMPEPEPELEEQVDMGSVETAMADISIIAPEPDVFTEPAPGTGTQQAKLSIALNAAGTAVLRIVLLDSETTADEPAPVEMAEVSFIEAAELDAEPELSVEEEAEQSVMKDLAFAEGDDVKVFSSSADEWVFGIIDQINYDAAEAEVRYEVDGEDRTKWVDCSEGSTEIKDANEEEAADESIVVGATRTRSGRDAKRVVYDESDGEDDEESFFEEDNDDAASSDEEFASADEEAEEEDEPPLSMLTMAELKVRLKAVGGTVAGKKADLVERLSVLLAAEPEEKTPEAEAEPDNEMPPAPVPEEPAAAAVAALVAPAISAVWASVHPDSPAAEEPAAATASALVAPAMSAVRASVHSDSPAAPLVTMPVAEVVLAPPEPPAPSPAKASGGLQEVTNTVAARTTPQGTPAKTPVEVGDMFDLDGFCGQMAGLNGTPAATAP